jgi:hypothetical protein
VFQVIPSVDVKVAAPPPLLFVTTKTLLQNVMAETEKPVKGVAGVDQV